MRNYLDDEIIARLKALKSISASDDLRSRVTRNWVQQLAPITNQHNVFVWWQRLALALLLLLVSGTGLVLAAETSSPGSPLYPVKQAVAEVKTKLNASVAGFNKPILQSSPDPNIAQSSPSPTQTNSDAEVKGVANDVKPKTQPVSSITTIPQRSPQGSHPSTLPTFEVSADEIEVQSIISVTKPTATPKEVRPSQAPPPSSPLPALEVPPVKLDAGLPAGQAGPVQIELNNNINGPPTVDIGL